MRRGLRLEEVCAAAAIAATLGWGPALAQGGPPGSAGAPEDRGARTTAIAPAAARMTLAEVVERARAVSPLLESLRFLEDAGEAGVRAAKAEWRPTLDLSASYTRYSDIPELTITLPSPGGAGTISRTIFPNIPDNYATRLGLSAPIYTGGRLRSQLAAAEGERLAAASDRAAGAADLVLEAATAYWDLVTAMESERVLEEALASYDAHLKEAGDRERFGLAASNEVLAVKVERERAELARLQAENAVEVIQANLARLLDRPAGSRVEPTEPLVPLAPPSEDVESLVTAAMASRPERARLAARIQEAEARARGARADRFPQVRFSAGYDYSRPNRRILPPVDRWEDTWDAAVLLSFHVFDFGRADAAVAQREAQAGAARKQLEDLDRRIRLEVTRRWTDLGTASASAAVAEANVGSARESRRVASDRYHAGVIPSSELLDAETALLRAGLERTEALARQRLSAAELDRAVGR